MFKSIRYGVRRYPTFVINRHEKVTGLDAALLEQVLRSQGL
jgi:predicted DsbA family dithiol-disulfide isomerase